MNVFSWLTSQFSNRGKALSLYKRGMARAKKHDHPGAIDDYTATIGMPDTPADVRAMALYNRALVHAADDNNSQAIEDLNRVLATAETPADVKIEARRKLERMRQKLARTESRSRKSHDDSNR